MSNTGDEFSARNYETASAFGAKFNIPEVETTAASFTTLTTAITALQTALGGLTNKLPNFASRISDELKKITAAANDTSTALAGTVGATGTIGTAGVRGTPTAMPGGVTGPAWAQTPVSPQNTPTDRPAGISMGSMFGSGGVAGMAVGAASWIRDRINTNRNTAIQASGQLAMLGQQQQGVSTAQLMGAMGNNNIGGMMGTIPELTGLFASLPQYGASVNFGGMLGQGGTGGQGRRAVGFMAGLQQMQAMNPMANVSDLTQTLGGFSSDVGAQKAGQMLTGGAFSIIGSGGRQKSLSQWADSILHWLEGLRPGAMRGKPFSYGDLMAQYWPGSNIDAWFNATGVSEGMKSYWWTYVLSKAGTTDTANWQIGAEPSNVAANRLKATTVLSQTELGLAGSMSGAYANREQANASFNNMMGAIQERIIPFISNLLGVSKVPDSIEDLIFGALNKFTGDVGDIGDLGQNDFGSTSLAGLNPDMKGKLGSMMRANPKLRITSSMRNEGAQARLKAKGYSNVSGRSSAHTRGQAADIGPPSQYGWIVRNARKFGMSSGAGVGEPWHVGMPGVGDISDTISSALGSMFDITGAALSDPTSLITSLLQKLFDLIGGGISKIPMVTPEKFQPGLPDPFAGIMSTIASGARTTTGGGSGSKRFPANTPVGGTLPLPGGGGPGTHDAGIAAATALFNAGFRKRQDLETITAISWRESKWNPAASNPNTSDRGLMQLNGVNWKKRGYSEADMFDIQKNANLAFSLWNAGGANQASFQQLWGFSEHSPYAVPPGGPGWDKNGDPLARTQGSNSAQIVRDSGLPVVGDVEQMVKYQPMPQQVGQSPTIAFSNVFHISGGGGSGGIDARQTAKLVADHLETEMKQRLARTN